MQRNVFHEGEVSISTTNHSISDNHIIIVMILFLFHSSTPTTNCASKNNSVKKGRVKEFFDR